MSLGEAFIEVRADMRPFIRDLDRQVRTAVERVEAATTASFQRSVGNAGQRAGEQAGERAGAGFNRKLKNSLDRDSPNAFVAIAGALASALDDGISALPTEVKAALVAGLLLATPLVGAILGAAITTSLGLALAGLGTLLAFQFEEVRTRAVEVGRNIRTLLVTSADSFGPAILNALDLVENKIESLVPVFKRIFDTAAGFIAPLTAGILEGVGTLVNVFDEIAPKLQPFIDTFALGIQSVLETIAEGLRRLANTGEAGQQALRDLFFIVNALIGSFFGLIELLTFVNQLFHELLNLAATLNPIVGILVRLLGKEIPHAEGALIVSNFDAASSFTGVIAATNAEEQEAKQLIKALDGLVDATYANIQTAVDFERSLDRISDSLKENGKSLDIHNEKGRQNVEAFTKGLKDAEEAAIQRLRTQGYTTEQAAQFYNQEIAQVRELARQAGISDAQFNSLFDEIILVSQLRISSEEMGVDGLAAGLDEATANALALLNTIRTLQRSTITGAVGGVKGFADGEIINRPTLGVFGEAGPEVIIPLTKPTRAAELAQKSGLTAMLGNDGSVVMVFIGEEQLEARMVKVVQRNNRNQATALSQGPRRF